MNRPRLIDLETWKAHYFVSGARIPGERSLRRQLKKWQEAGIARKIAGSWFIDEVKLLADGDPLVEKALAG